MGNARIHPRRHAHITITHDPSYKVQVDRLVEKLLDCIQPDKNRSG